MYVSILAGALERWDSELDEDELLDYVRRCRASLPAHDLGAGTISASALAAEVTYDRALVWLAAQLGIDVSPTNFIHPRIERDRLELEVVSRGVDLELTVRERVAPKSPKATRASAEP
jgi:hypothetical protein